MPGGGLYTMPPKHSSKDYRRYCHLAGNFSGESGSAEWVEAPEMAPGKLGVWGLIVLCTFRRYPIDWCARLLLFSASSYHFYVHPGSSIGQEPQPARGSTFDNVMLCSTLREHSVTREARGSQPLS